jgi:hypothetical protein
MPVAKSYQKYEIICEPFIDNGRAYVNIKKDGSLKTVRWYTDKEYATMYKLPKNGGASLETVSSKPPAPVVKDILGFKNGFITLITGPTENWEEYLNMSNARYSRVWGWYIISTEIVPSDLPDDLTTMTLSWSLVGNEDGTLLPEDKVVEAVETLKYPATPSQYVGKVGDRLSLDLTVAKSIPIETIWGRSTLHVMVDANDNEFIWKTNSKSWEVGSQRHLKGTVKEHKIWRNSQQTWLTRCQEVKD